MLAVILTGAQLNWLEQSLRISTMAQQKFLADHIADALEDKIASRLQVMAKSAETLNAELVDQPRVLRGAIIDNVALHELFDVVFISNADGDTLYSSRPTAAGVNISDRAYFKRAMTSVGALVSEPVQARANGLPAIVFAAPMRNSNGQTVAVLGGVLNLSSENILGSLSRTHLGEGGYFAVSKRGSSPLYIMHPDAARILSPIDDADATPSAWRAAAGFEGTIEDLDTRRKPAMLTYRAIPTVNWTLTVSYPASEAYATLRTEVRWMVVLAATFIVAMIGVIVWWVRRALQPLDDMRRKMVDGARNPDAMLRLEAQGDDELADLARAFNIMMNARQRVRTALQESESKLRLITDNVDTLIAYIDPAYRYQFANKRYEDWFGVPVDAILGQTMAEFMGEAAFQEFEPHIRDALLGLRVQFTREHAQPDGRVIVAQVTYLPHVENGIVLGVYSITHDITPLKAVELQLRTLATSDTLTGLPNRRAFDELLDAAVSRAASKNGHMALLYLDVDRFKQINDSGGHALGDAALRGFAERLKKHVVPGVIAARIAGDEFAVIVETAESVEELENLAAAIVTTMRHPLHINGEAIAVTASVGIAWNPMGRLHGLALMHEADRALYEAKAAGRNTWRVATTDWQDARTRLDDGTLTSPGLMFPLV
ncbi:hypothetical protein BH09PSE6_BH09PSE6_21630 [soil metagenome]